MLRTESPYRKLIIGKVNSGIIASVNLIFKSRTAVMGNPNLLNLNELNSKAQHQ